MEITQSDRDWETRTKFAVDDFLSHAKRLMHTGDVVSENITVLKPDSVVDTRDPLEIDREWFELYKNTARVEEIVATMVHDPESIYMIKLQLVNGDVLDVRTVHPEGDSFHLLPPVQFSTIHNDTAIVNKTFKGLLDGIHSAMGNKFHSTIPNNFDKE